MTDKTVSEYYKKRRQVFARRNERQIAEFRVLYLEGQFRLINRLLDRTEFEAVEQQLGEAYKILMKLKSVKKQQ